MKREELEQKIEVLEGNILHYKDVNKLHKQAKKELKQLKEQLEELPKLEVGRWYKVFRDEIETPSLVVFSGHNVPTYGFTHISRSWTESYGCNNTFRNPDYRYSPATPQEVEEALIKEAKKRGFKEGVTFRPLYSDSSEYYSDFVLGENLYYDSKENSIHHHGGARIFVNGKWATIIEPKVSISGDFTKQDLEKIIQTEFK